MSILQKLAPMFFIAIFMTNYGCSSESTNSDALNSPYSTSKGEISRTLINPHRAKLTHKNIENLPTSTIVEAKSAQVSPVSTEDRISKIETSSFFLVGLELFIVFTLIAVISRYRMKKFGITALLLMTALCAIISVLYLKNNSSPVQFLFVGFIGMLFQAAIEGWRNERNTIRNSKNQKIMRIQFHRFHKFPV